ncbi:MAG: glutaredoxin 3 [Neisseriaceae bacterium]|nr:glutaredoxin 3 [Neisseriaceae bacterium]MBR5676143.1 glutaredoxin 3 [Neisseriaceae bacterium]MBR5939637.1 glutaredoxin 3 [Neisseriaceae bacterium]
MPHIQIYTTGFCPYCTMAKNLLKQKGINEWEEIRIDLSPDAREKMMSQTGRKTVPQIFIGDTHVGGFDDLNALNKTGDLDKLLQ